jgi:hypothetical protein
VLLISEVYASFCFFLPVNQMNQHEKFARHITMVPSWCLEAGFLLHVHKIFHCISFYLFVCIQGFQTDLSLCLWAQTSLLEFLLKPGFPAYSLLLHRSSHWCLPFYCQILTYLSHNSLMIHQLNQFTPL